MYSKITLVGLSALIVSPEILSYPSVRDWRKFAQKQPKGVCARQGGKASSSKSGMMHFSISHLPGTSSPALE